MLKNKKSFFKVCFFRTLFFIKKIFLKKKKDKYILIINYNNLGDLVCDSPSLRNIRKSFPKHKIILFVRNQQCVNFMGPCPYIDEIVEMPHSNEPFKNYTKFAKKYLKYNFEFSIQLVRPFLEYYRTYLPYLMCIKKRYGLIQMGYEKLYKRAFTHKYYLDNTTTRIEESVNLAKMLNIVIDNYKTECWLDVQSVKHFNYSNYIIIQTCATLKSRMWNKRRFVELINLIVKNNRDVLILLTGTNKEKEYIEEIKKSCTETNNVKVVCDVNISTLLNLIKNAQLLITNDTGPYHFAQAFGVPTITIFGISPPEYLIKKKTKNNIYFRGCSTCPLNCDIKETEKDCQKIYKNNNNECHCVNNVLAKDVYLAFEKMYSSIKH